MGKYFTKRLALVATLVSLSVPGTGSAAALSVKTGAPSANRSASLCVDAAGCVDGLPEPPAEAPLWGHPACIAGTLVTPSPLGSCEVQVNVPVSGTGTAGASVKLTVTLRLWDNRPWAHPVERAVDEESPDEAPNPGDPPSTVPLPIPEEVPDDVPVPREIEVPEVPVEGVEIAEVKPGVWTASKTVKVGSNGKYSTAVTFRFESGGFSAQCETFDDVKTVAAQGSKKVSHSRGSTVLCA